MTTPIDDLERRLRATLDRHAREAPPGPPLAERILLEVEAPVLRPRHGWRIWVSPLIAAAAIVAAALALVNLGNEHHGAAPAPAATQPVPTPCRRHRHTSRPAPTASPTTATTTVRTVATGVRGFRADDITFDGPTEGWALGSATCVHGRGRCTEILHTTDGTSWSPAPNGESFDVPGVRACADPCVTGLRFANSLDRLRLRRQGAVHDHRRRCALEPTAGSGRHRARDGGRQRGARPGRGFRGVRCSGEHAVGSSTWTPFAVPGFSVPVGGTVQLSRAFGVTLLTVVGYDWAQTHDRLRRGVPLDGRRFVVDAVDAALRRAVDRLPELDRGRGGQCRRRQPRRRLRGADVRRPGRLRQHGERRARIDPVRPAVLRRQAHAGAAARRAESRRPARRDRRRHALPQHRRRRQLDGPGPARRRQLPGLPLRHRRPGAERRRPGDVDHVRRRRHLDPGAVPAGSSPRPALAASPPINSPIRSEIDQIGELITAIRRLRAV